MTDLRSDIICEKIRSPLEIRKELATLIRLQRRLLARDTRSSYIDTNAKYRANDLINLKIELLVWVLRHDVSPQDYYKQEYRRDYPNA